MWLWLAVGWAVAALVVAAVHHRWRRLAAAASPEVAAFGLRLENELTQCHPGVAFLGMLPDRFACLLQVDGQETVVSLHELFRHGQGDCDAFTRSVATLVAEIREVGLDAVTDRDFAAAAPLLMPQVRSRAWLDSRGTFGDSGLVHSPLAEGLVTVYVVDDPTTMVFVCREHLRRWRKAVADVHNLAVQNLARRGGRLQDVRNGATVVHTGDGFDAARVLLLPEDEGLLVAIPDRDTLWVGPEQGQDLARLMATTAAVAEAALHPVSAQVYRLTAGRLEALPGSR
ncbi:MAG: hypothetical protein WAT39_16600 [Planctomycetota bacterium]